MTLDCTGTKEFSLAPSSCKTNTIVATRDEWTFARPGVGLERPYEHDIDFRVEQFSEFRIERIRNKHAPRHIITGIRTRYVDLLVWIRLMSAASE